MAKVIVTGVKGFPTVNHYGFKIRPGAYASIDDVDALSYGESVQTVDKAPDGVEVATFPGDTVVDEKVKIEGE